MAGITSDLAKKNWGSPDNFRWDIIAEPHGIPRNSPRNSFYISWNPKEQKFAGELASLDVIFPIKSNNCKTSDFYLNVNFYFLGKDQVRDTTYTQ